MSTVVVRRSKHFLIPFLLSAQTCCYYEPNLVSLVEHDDQHGPRPWDHEAFDAVLLATDDYRLLLDFRPDDDSS